METMEKTSVVNENHETLQQYEGIMDTNDNKNIITTNQDNNKTALIKKDDQQPTSNYI